MNEVVTFQVAKDCFPHLPNQDRDLLYPLVSQFRDAGGLSEEDTVYHARADIDYNTGNAVVILDVAVG